MLKLAKKRAYNKSIIVFLCLLVVGNIIHWRVLCIGADGQVRIESAFHKHGNKTDQSHEPICNNLIYTTNQEIDEHYSSCVDIPITNELLRISKTTQKLNLKYPVSTTCFLVDSNNFKSSEYHLVTKTFSDTSYTPLCTVILQI